MMAWALLVGFHATVLAENSSFDEPNALGLQDIFGIDPKQILFPVIFCALVWFAAVWIPRFLRAWEVFVSTPDDHIISDRNPVSALNKFLAALPAWKKADAHVYWKQDGWKHLSMQDYMVSSVQLLGTCWLHAVVVLQHLLVVKSSGKADHRKVAIYKFIAMHKDYHHAKFIYDNGGCSVEALKAITEKPFLRLEDDPISSKPHLLLSTAQAVADDFNKYGPGLVSSFQVDDNFQRKGTGSFLNDEVTGKTVGHAMVLVGYRKDLIYGHIFLLQNWWNEMEYLEVSAQYMARAKAQIHFVTEPLDAIPRDLPVMDAVATEASDGTGGDKSTPEY